MPDSEKTRPITLKRLTNIALYYLGRYDSSAEQLRRVLSRRVLKEKIKGAEVPSEAEEWIEKIVSQMCRDGYVNDQRFAENQVRKYQAAGKSKQFLIGKLKMAGINAEIIQNLPELETDSDFEAACRFVRKKKIGFFRPPEKQKECYKKDLAALARAGFSFDIAVKALGEQNDEDFYE